MKGEDTGKSYEFWENYRISEYKRKQADLDTYFIPITGEPFKNETCSRTVYPSRHTRQSLECSMIIIPSVSQNATIEVQADFLDIESLLVTKYYPKCKGDHHVIMEYDEGEFTYSKIIELIGTKAVHINKETEVYFKRCQASNWYLKITEIKKHYQEVFVSPSLLSIHMIDNITYTMPYTRNLQKHRWGLDVTTEIDQMLHERGISPSVKDRLFILEIRLADVCKKRCMDMYIFYRYSAQATGLYQWSRNRPEQWRYEVAFIGLNLTEAQFVATVFQYNFNENCVAPLKQCTVSLSFTGSDLYGNGQICASKGSLVGYTIHGRCFMLMFPKHHVTWMESNAICDHQGGVLSVPNDGDEMDQLKMLAFYKYAELIDKEIIFIGLKQTVS